MYEVADPDSDDDVIAERMSRIHGQMSSVIWAASVEDPAQDDGIPLCETYLCMGCGENFPDTDRECPSCGWRTNGWLASSANDRKARAGRPSAQPGN